MTAKRVEQAAVLESGASRASCSSRKNGQSVSSASPSTTSPARLSQSGAPQAPQSRLGSRDQSSRFCRCRAAAWRRSAGGRRIRLGYDRVVEIEDSCLQQAANPLFPDRRRVPYPAHDFVQIALGRVAAGDGQLPAEAAIAANVGVDEVGAVAAPSLDAVQDVGHVLQSLDRDRVDVAHARDLAARHDPTQTADAHWLVRVVIRAVAQGAQKRPVQLGNGERTVERRGPAAERPLDGVHQRGAGTDVEHPDFRGLHPILGGQPPTVHARRHFTRRIDGNQVRNQIRVFELDQPNHRGTGHGDLRPGSAAVGQIGVAGRGHHLADPRNVASKIET